MRAIMTIDATESILRLDAWTTATAYVIELGRTLEPRCKSDEHSAENKGQGCAARFGVEADRSQGRQ